MIQTAPGRTLNYNPSKPSPPSNAPSKPSPPALPRFSAPCTERGLEESDDGGAADSLDAAVTAQRPALRARGPRRVVRRKVQPDATEEIGAEDISVEVHAEAPRPPPPIRSRLVVARSDRPERPERGEQAIAAVIASVSLPPPARSAAVDALLRRSDPAFAPLASSSRGRASPSAFTYPPRRRESPVVHESPSVAPVELPPIAGALLALAPPSHGGLPPAPAVPTSGAPSPTRVRPAPLRGGRGLTRAVWTMVLLATGVAAAAGIRNGTYARLRQRVKAVVAERGRWKDAASPALASPALASAARSAPAVPAVPAVPPALPTVPVRSLSQTTAPEVSSDSSLVTLPATARGHRVFFDGRLLAVTGAPIKVRCGRHVIRIGSMGKARVVDLGCSQEVTLK